MRPIATRFISGVRLVCLAAGIVTSLGSSRPARAADAAAPCSFKMTTSSRYSVQAGPEKEENVAETELVYTWRFPAAGERVLSFDSLRLKLDTDGKSVMDMFMSADKLEKTKDGTTSEWAVKNAPEKTKLMFRETFGAPLCRVEVGKDGREVRRAVTATKGALATMSGDGMIVCVLAFHPSPPPAGRDEWEAETEFRSEGGVTHRGRLTYKKSPGGKGGQAYAVSGTLTTPPAVRAADVPKADQVATTGTCVVAGEQTFDPARREWVATRVKVTSTIRKTKGDQVIHTLAGTQAITIETTEAAPAER